MSVAINFLRIGYYLLESAYNPMCDDLSYNSSLRWNQIESIFNSIPKWKSPFDLLEELNSFKGIDTKSWTKVNGKTHFIKAKEILDEVVEQGRFDKKSGMELIYHCIFGVYDGVTGRAGED